MNLKIWLNAFRLRTLPLSLSGIIIAYFYFVFENSETKLSLFILALLTTLFLQILSNLANDYGDGVKGTDNKDRIGPERGLQSGNISQTQIKTAIVIFSILSFSSGISLLYLAFGKENWLNLLIFLGVGLLAIAAAIKYTVGKSAYGYRALGDLFVFLFFGLVGVGGFYILLTQKINLEIILLSVIIGAFSAMVLNLNNMRDVENDKKSNKITIPVLLGFKKSKLYHYFLGDLIIISILIFNYLVHEPLIWFNLLILIPFILHIIKVTQIKEYKDFDPELKKVALTTFAFAILNSILLSLC